MAVGFMEIIQNDLDIVAEKISEAFKIKAGHLAQFAHLANSPLDKDLRPSLVLMMSDVFGNSGEQVADLAAVVQFIYMATAVHFRISDIDSNLEEKGLDVRDGDQVPVLVGDYLYGKFFTTLCAADLIDFLDPLAQVIAENHQGGMIRKQHPHLAENDPTYLNIINKETAATFVCACRLSAILAQASAEDINKAADFGLNLGMAYGLIERNKQTTKAGPYFDRALALLQQLPDSSGKQNLRGLLDSLRQNPDIIPAIKIGSGLDLGKEVAMTDNVKLNTAKEKKVQSFFNDIAGKYDFMNTLSSFGRHHHWRKVTVAKANAPKGGYVLDVCCGTGLVTMDLAKKVGPQGKVVGLDFSEQMLEVAKGYLKDFPLKDNVELIQGNAMDLPFADNTFDCVTIAYGLRNVPDLKRTLNELYRVVKPGGRVVSLEFAKPYVPVFKQIYDFYVDKWMPLMGKINAKNKEAYKYLHDSIVAYPHQNEVTRLYREVGFLVPQCFELTLGIVAVHTGIKPSKQDSEEI